MVCPANLPKAGSKVDVVGVGTATVMESTPAALSELYGGAFTSTRLPPGFDEGCTLKIQYADGTTDVVSAAEAPQSAFSEALDVAVFPAYVAAYALLLSADSDSEHVDQYSQMTREFEDHCLDATPTKEPPPEGLAALDGEYWGGSNESDEGDQAIRVRLHFSKSGRITGRGRDDVDGSYRIADGRWTALPDGNLSLQWKETYDEGFDVICKGRCDTSSGKIDARFASSRGVSGTFKLARKPSIF